MKSELVAYACADRITRIGIDCGFTDRGSIRLTKVLTEETGVISRRNGTSFGEKARSLYLEKGGTQNLDGNVIIQYGFGAKYFAGEIDTEE